MATVRQHKMKLKKQVKTKEKNIDWFTIYVFDNVPDILRLSQDDEGKRIWLAGESQMYATKINLVSYNGDTLDITYQGEKKYRSVYEDEALLHPDEITKERLEEYGYQIKDGRKNA